jgi:tetratricopeptide (TPR) repeat protein
MAFREVTTTVNSLFKALTTSLFEKNQFKYGREVLIGLGCIAFTGGSFFAYRWYSVSKNQSAQVAFSEQLEKYYMAHGSDSANWESVGLELKNVSRVNGGTSLSPYFLALQADVLLEQDKHDEALTVMDQMLNEMPSSSPLRNLYQTKRALMALDSDDQARKTSGLQELDTLAHDANNKNADVALFYLGRYHWVAGDEEQARIAWQELVDQQQHELVAPSPWAQEARTLLQQIAS